MDNKRSFATGTNGEQLNCSFNSSWLSKITWIYDQLSNISGSITENQYKEINEGAVLNPTIIAFEEHANDGFERIGGCNDKLFFQEPFREYEFTESQQFITKHISMKCWMHKELPIEHSRLDRVLANIIPSLSQLKVELILHASSTLDWGQSDMHRIALDGKSSVW